MWGANFSIDTLPAAAFDPVTFAPISLTLDSAGNLIGKRPMVVKLDIDILSSGFNGLFLDSSRWHVKVSPDESSDRPVARRTFDHAR